jgi:hypothetical protein
MIIFCSYDFLEFFSTRIYLLQLSTMVHKSYFNEILEKKQKEERNKENGHAHNEDVYNSVTVYDLRGS